MSDKKNPAPMAVGDGARKAISEPDYPSKLEKAKAEFYYLHVHEDETEVRYYSKPEHCPTLSLRLENGWEYTRTWNRAPADIENPRRLYPVRPPGQGWELRDRLNGSCTLWHRKAVWK
jgi:hypothetical protein